MSRSGYIDDTDDWWAHIRWRGAVKSAIHGERGQALLREALAALDEMPVKELAARSFQADGQYCTLGVVAAKRGLNVTHLQCLAEHGDSVAQEAAETFGIARALAAEIMYENDESVDDDERAINVEICGPVRRWESHRRVVWMPRENAAALRWQHMRGWIASNIKVA